jgi:hypothetical protein
MLGIEVKHLVISLCEVMLRCEIVVANEVPLLVKDEFVGKRREFN